MIRRVGYLSFLILSFSVFGNYGEISEVEIANKRVNCGNIVTYNSQFWVYHHRHNVHISIDPTRSDTVHLWTSNLVHEWISNVRSKPGTYISGCPYGCPDDRVASSPESNYALFFTPAQVKVPKYKPENSLQDLPSPPDFNNYVHADITGNPGKTPGRHTGTVTVDISFLYDRQCNILIDSPY